MNDLCGKLHRLFHELPVFGFPFDDDMMNIPLNGIYILFESGEIAHGVNRIVRVGTHSGDDQLRSRLEQHFIHENKDRSIFRKNIGRAILNRDKDPFLLQWDLDLTTRKAREGHEKTIDFSKQKEVERLVTKYIQGRFRFVVFSVDDKNMRLELESKIISTISLCHECRPSKGWLGLHSPKVKIRECGLWNVNQLYKQPLCESDFSKIRKLFLK